MLRKMKPPDASASGAHDYSCEPANGMYIMLTQQTQIEILVKHPQGGQHANYGTR